MRGHIRKGLGALVLLAASPAVAQAPDPGLDPALPIPTLDLERIPPRTSYELALHMSYGTLGYWRNSVPSWIGFGIRGGWGRNVNRNHRFGGDIVAIFEGPIGVHSTIGLEPQVTWNYISDKQLLLGAGLGPSLLWHSAAGESQYRSGEDKIGVAPTAVARIGWSQTWTRIGRRSFVVLEPKVRYVRDGFNPLVALVVGSGGGR